LSPVSGKVWPITTERGARWVPGKGVGHGDLPSKGNGKIVMNEEWRKNEWGGETDRSGWGGVACPMLAGSASKGILLLSLFGLLWGCGGEETPAPPRASGPEAALPDPGSFSLQADSDHGMVVSGNPFASRAGVEMLEAGGNAVDAAVATAFALAVVEPSQSGLGGRTQALVRLPDGGFHGIDGTTQVPLGYDAAKAPSVERGYSTVAIPGTVKALTRLLAEHGTLPLERVLVPAIRFAEGGFPITEGEARRIASVAEELREFEWAARYFLKADGSPYQGGDILVQTDLAEVLKTLAREGPDAFYAGDLARRMVEDFQTNGGFLTLEDLAQYEAEDAVLARGSYRDREVVGTYLPASGATVIEILQILENLPLGQMPEADRAGALSQALLLGFDDREETQFRPPPEVVARLTSKEWAAELARKIRMPEGSLEVTEGAKDPGPTPGSGDPASAEGGGPVARPATGPGAETGGQEAGAREATGAGAEPQRWHAPSAPEEWPHTTHLSVADKEGVVVAMTQSLGPTLGSWVVTPGLGFVYAATTGGYLADTPPGGRPWSSQAPLIVLEEGVPRYVLGGAGARRIVSALVSVVSRLIDDGMGLSEAMAAPRLHPSGVVVTVETVERPGVDPEAVEAALEHLGFEVETRPFGSWFALLNAVELRWRGGGVEARFRGVADPRWAWGGAAVPGEQ
jgi:gamma-glutamyltranspeptidase/glutathione hydrolase